MFESRLTVFFAITEIPKHGRIAAINAIAQIQQTNSYKTYKYG
jgi:hypothetical protein